MELTSIQKKQLKAIAHNLKPVVMIGQYGIKDSIHDEIALALEHHQLIKIKMAGMEKAERSTLQTAISQQHQATIIQTIGAIVVLYRRNKKKDSIFKLPF